MYSRENAIINAKTTSGIENLFFRNRHIAAAEATLAAACPEGNEESDAFAPISRSPSTTSYGRTRPTKGFNRQLLSNSEPINAKAEQTPARRVFRKNNKIAVSTIQKAPAVPRNVMFGKM